MKRHIVFFALSVFLLAGCSKETEIGDVAEFIRAEIESGKTHIVIPKGVHYLKADSKDKGAHISLIDLQNITISGYGAELRFTNKNVRGIRILRCKNIKLEGFTVDCDPINISQGVITKVSEDGLSFEGEIFKGYRTYAENPRYLMIFDSKTLKQKSPMYYPKDIKIFDGNRIKITMPKKFSPNPVKIPVEKVGDLFCFSVSSAGGILAYESEGITYKDITVYASDIMGFLDIKCSGIVFDSCKITRRSLSSDFGGRDFPRLRSTTAYGYHSRGAKVGPQIINCVGEYMADDCIALEAVYHIAYDVENDYIRLIVRDEKDILINKGDKVEIYFPDGKTTYAQAVDVKYAGKTTDAQYDYIKTLPFSPRFKKPRLAHNFLLKIDKNIEIPRGSLIVGMKGVCSGYKIIGGRFGNVRSRGLLLKAPNGIVDGVHVEACATECIKIAPEHYYLEAPHVENVVIKNCYIDASWGRAFDTHSKMFLVSKYSPAGAHNNVKFINNTVKYFYTPACVLTSIKGAEFVGNKLIKSESSPIESWYRTEAKEPMYIVNCPDLKCDTKLNK